MDSHISTKKNSILHEMLSSMRSVLLGKTKVNALKACDVSSLVNNHMICSVRSLRPLRG